MNSKGELTPGEYLAMNISGRMDALEARIDAAIHHVNVNIRCDLLEVEMMLESIEECDRKYPRVKPHQQGGKN
ncbi:hypothetical protein AVDCRST_MAG84-6036 [uncultured Microcoleus sp.]|uniref:Uncharacterized protein n=1 Tax=uncultured Microcoleus sp. TaxID=259945 RepID=A0A6J4P3R5_9CYAN|nr:hypothetical protein AVDCRST_MAG84-6036 [uncultured Microcoleus sp.]